MEPVVAAYIMFLIAVVSHECNDDVVYEQREGQHSGGGEERRFEQADEVLLVLRIREFDVNSPRE